MECIFGEGGVGTPSHDGATGWGGCSCIEDKTIANDIELVVEANWSAMNWFTTSPFSMATM
jgi:hypothetical protein